MSHNADPDAIEAVKDLSRALKALHAAGIIRSRRYTGDLGGWYVEQLYRAERARVPTQKGWDNLVPASGDRLQVKTQSFDPQNRWNYLGINASLMNQLPSLFDRLIVVLLTDNLTVGDLYDVPVSALVPLLHVGKEQKPWYNWDDLVTWRVNPRTLLGYAGIAELIETPA